MWAIADCVSTKLVGKEAGGAELVDDVDPDEVAAEVVAQEREAAQAEGAAAEAHTSGAADEQAASPVRAHRVPTAEPEPIDLLGTAGVPVLRRLIPVLAGAVGLVLISKLVRRRRPDTD